MDPLDLIMVGIGFVIYAIAAGVLITALKGGDLSVLYPIISTSYIWISLFSPIFFSTDSMNMIKWSGIGFIVIGVSLIGIGGGKGATAYTEAV